MTSILESLDSGRTTGKTGFGLASLWQSVVSLFVRYRNRREIIRLSELPDSMLDDIGLTRDDLTYATRGGPFDDHSAELARIAILRRTFVQII